MEFYMELKNETGRQPYIQFEEIKWVFSMGKVIKRKQPLYSISVSVSLPLPLDIGY